jgi:predicted nuclease of predicted toxin-antitoxin system
VKILIDMNLSPDWEKVFAEENWESKHWMSVGLAHAPDVDIMQWALEHGYLVFTHDLDFGALLAASGASGPSVVQMRSEEVRPMMMRRVVVDALCAFESELRAGALLTIDPRRMRVSLLPLRNQKL